MPVTIPIPPQFLQRMRLYLGNGFPAFAASLQQPAERGLRVNTLKLTPRQFQVVSPFPLEEQVEWCSSAFHLSGSPRTAGSDGETPEPGKQPFHAAGLYYLQDPSAMSAAELLAPQTGERILDLAAAPGGKTTHLASLLEGSGLLVANEIKSNRVNHLVQNLERWGVDNVVVTNETPERLADVFGAWFDRVLVDAPCSGEGMFRKENSARADWSLQMVAGCAIRQKNILRVASRLVRPGGSLLYSTCTFAPEEDEAVILDFLQAHPDFDIQSVRSFPGFLPGKPEWLDMSPPPEVGNQLRHAMRLLPNLVRGEGHFVCLLKRSTGSPAPHLPAKKPARVPPGLLNLWRDFQQQVLRRDFPENRLIMLGSRLYFLPSGLPDLRGLRIAMPGLWLGNFKTGRFEPAHPLALFLRPGQAGNCVDFPAGSREVMAYLRGETLPSPGSHGWTLVTVDGWSLGWGKRVQGVLKNHYPRGWLVSHSG